MEEKELQQVEKAEGRNARFLDKFNIRDEKNIVIAGKILLFFMLVFVAGLTIVQLFINWVEAWRIIVAVSVLAGLIIEEFLKLFIVKRVTLRAICYIFDFLFAFALVATTGSSYMPILYIIVLTEFYLSAQKMRSSVLMFTISVPLYLCAYAAAISLWEWETVSFMRVFSQSFEALVFLSVHFIVVNFLLGFYRQYLRLKKTMKELDESNERLKEANEHLAEVTALEERQRIAKEIHDTAGHSITTVIMQTEAAKLIVEKDAAQAKQKIVAANLQAKHALEELRESVHLLSGSLGKITLKTALLEIIAESTDGTDVKIRHDVDDIVLCDAKYRLICNALREGISNGLRHGGATAFYFELKESESRIEFLLSDNGKGMEIEKLKEGFGLSGMIKAVEALGGSANIYTEPDEGFEIRFSLPADEE